MTTSNIVLIDSIDCDQLLPITYIRPVSHIRLGYLSIREKWEHYSKQIVQILSKSEFGLNSNLDNNQAVLGIHAGLLPDEAIILQIQELKEGDVLISQDHEILAAKSSFEKIQDLFKQGKFERGIFVKTEAKLIKNLWDIIDAQLNQIELDITLLISGRTSANIDPSVRIIGDPSKVFLESGAKVYNCSINTQSGSVYIAKDAEVMEGAMIRGPFALGEHSQVKMGAKIYPGVATGQHCKIGGEIGNTVFQEYSNKGHDGYLGDSFIGSWCNMGADTNSSNLKNNYSEVKLWSYPARRFVSTGKQFCGLIMGDHSKCGINTMFNTGTVVGVSCNIFGDGFPRNFIPSFSWGGASGFTGFAVNKAIEASNAMMGRRGVQLSENDKTLFQSIWEADSEWRKS